MRWFFSLFIFLIACQKPSPTVPAKILAELQDTSLEVFEMTGDIEAKLVNNLKKFTKNKVLGDTLLIYINSIGGHVNSAESIINIMAGYKTICLADIAYSAAFEIFQHCTVRIYNDDTSLMTHYHFAFFKRQSTMTSSELLDYGFSMYIQEVGLLTRCAARMNMTYLELTEKINENNGEWYLHGDEILRHSAADYYLNDLKMLKVKK